MKRRLIFSIFSLLFSITASAQKTDSARVHFEKAFEEISGMLTGKNPLSFKRAVFLSENAYLDNRLSYSAFDLSIKSAASYCQRMAENLPINHPKEKPLGVNYTIFQHITDTTKHISGKDTFDFLPFRYDFNDFSGQKSWESMFVTKLLRERTGNCRSLPYYYKILADECGVEAFLALAPNHIYIKHRDIGKQKEGWQRRVYNIELTNGSFPMDGWLMASGYITLDAIRSGYYLDTLSQSQAVAMCLFDLAKAYERKFGKRDEFVSRCVERVLLIHPANINALLLKTELLKDRYEQTKAPADYQNVEKHCSTLVANGYREMPLDMYLNWLFEVRAKGDAFVNVKHQPKKFDTQKGNPYKNDTTMKIHMQTLTDGRYDEFPEFAETTYVGSAVYDVYKKKIIGFIKRDTLYSEATLEPEVVSRWLSTDPVFHPYESPYVGFANNPVYFIDPRGTTVGKYYDSETGKEIKDDKINDNKIYITNQKTGTTEHVGYDQNYYSNRTIELCGKTYERPLNPDKPVIWDVTTKFEVTMLKTATFFMQEQLDDVEKGRTTKVDRLKYFGTQVTDKAPYDIKRTSFSEKALGAPYGLYKNRLMQPQDFGNFNFGVAARAYGFSELTGLVGAGVNQLGKGSKFYDLSNWEGFGDDKRDTFFIKLGYEWWNSTK